MGGGDLYDTQFDEMEEAADYDEFLQIFQAESVFHTASNETLDDYNIFTKDGLERRLQDESSIR